MLSLVSTESIRLLILTPSHCSSRVGCCVFVCMFAFLLMKETAFWVIVCCRTAIYSSFIAKYGPNYVQFPHSVNLCARSIVVVALVVAILIYCCARTAHNCECRDHVILILLLLWLNNVLARLTQAGLEYLKYKHRFVCFGENGTTTTYKQYWIWN